MEEETRLVPVILGGSTALDAFPSVALGKWPFVIIFVAPPSKQWKAVKILASGAENTILAGDALLVCFGTGEAQSRLFGSIFGISKNWKSAYFFKDGAPIDAREIERWVECYVASFKARDLNAYCLAVPSVFVTPVPYLLPCRLLSFWSVVTSGHPSTPKDQVHAEAARRRYLDCPNFDIENFREPNSKRPLPKTRKLPPV